jgi:hypothetical protein
MLKTRVLLLSSMVPAGAWAASANLDQSRLILQVVCAIIVSFAIFVAVLLATGYRNTNQPRAAGRVRATTERLAFAPRLPRA